MPHGTIVYSIDRYRTSRGEGMPHAAVLIPAWMPDRSLVKLVHALGKCGFGAIIVVDDGSGEGSAFVFAEIENISTVHVLRHPCNLGKGRALKTGIEYFLTELDLEVLITADADGQHAVEDIVSVGKALCGAADEFALGSRFFGRRIPLRSRVGNALTRWIFALVTGVRLTDTQTGLRAFPRLMLPGLLNLAGERYEYEMNVLAHLCQGGGQGRGSNHGLGHAISIQMPIQVPIRTIYVDGNRCSHFDPVRDSARIYLVLARFYCATRFASLLPRRDPLLR
jgi:glycosyltransferase involved in cell wall biosynthesis